MSHSSPGMNGDVFCGDRTSFTLVYSKRRPLCGAASLSARHALTSLGHCVTRLYCFRVGDTPDVYALPCFRVGDTPAVYALPSATPLTSRRLRELAAPGCSTFDIRRQTRAHSWQRTRQKCCGSCDPGLQRRLRRTRTPCFTDDALCETLTSNAKPTHPTHDGCFAKSQITFREHRHREPPATSQDPRYSSWCSADAVLKRETLAGCP